MSTSKRTESTFLKNLKRPLMMTAAGVGAFLATSFQDVNAQDVKKDTTQTNEKTVVTGIIGIKPDSANMAEKEKLNIQKKKLSYGNPVQYNGYDAPEKKYDKSAKDPLYMSYLGVAMSTTGGNVGFNWGGVVPLFDWVVLNPEIRLTGARFGGQASYSTPQNAPYWWDSYVSWSRQFSEAKLNALIAPTIPLKKDGESFIKPGLVGTAIVFPGGYVNDLLQADFAAGVGAMMGLKIADLGKSGSAMLFAKGEFMPLYHSSKLNRNYYMNNIWINGPGGNGQSPKREPYVNVSVGASIRFHDNKGTNSHATNNNGSNADSYKLAKQVKQDAEAMRQEQLDINAKDSTDKITKVDYALYDNEDGTAYLDWSKKEIDATDVSILILFQETAPIGSTVRSTIMSTQTGHIGNGLDKTLKKHQRLASYAEQQLSLK